MAKGQKGSGDDVERGRLALPCDPSPMAFDKYRSHVPLVLHDRTWPDGQFDHAPPLGQRRPARRQPGSHRPHGLRAQARAVPDPDRRRVQGDRGRVPLGLSDRLRLPAPHHRREPGPRRRRDPGARAVPPGADRAHLRVARRCDASGGALLQLGVRAAAPRRLRAGQGRHHRHRGEGGASSARSTRRRSPVQRSATSTRRRASPEPSPTTRWRSARR